MSALNDKIVLVGFYVVTGGERWRSNSGWTSADPLSEWEGVTVDAAGRVTKLSQDSSNLSGMTILTTSDVSY